MNVKAENWREAWFGGAEVSIGCHPGSFFFFFFEFYQCLLKAL